MGIKINFDTKKIMKELENNIKSEKLLEIKCPKCNNLVGKYSYNYLKERGELFCDICEDSFIVDINFNMK